MSLLSDSQDFEERLKTVDYDVWECPECGTIERFPFRARQKKYTECPRCHTVAMCLQCDMIVRQPTVRAEGQASRSTNVSSVTTARMCLTAYRARKTRRLQ